MTTELSKYIENEGKRVFVMTDLEPDDALLLIFLKVFIGYGAPMLIDTILAGESPNPRAIAESAGKLAYCMQSDNMMPNIMIGMGSKKEFPLRGLEHTGDARPLFAPDYSREAFISSVLKYVQTCEESGVAPLMIIAKPPREFLDCADVPELTEAMGKITALFYGGFNFRCVMARGGAANAAEPVQTMLGKFKETVIYESFAATGANNSVNAIENPKLFSLLNESNEPCFKVACRLMHNWNKYLAGDCIETCESLMTNPGDFRVLFNAIKNMTSLEEQKQAVLPLLKDAGSVERFVVHNAKPLASIEKCEENQLLLADQCAVAAFFSKEMREKYLFPVSVSFNEYGYTQMTKIEDGSPSKFFGFIGIPREEMIVELEKILNSWGPSKCFF